MSNNNSVASMRTALLLPCVAGAGAGGGAALARPALAALARPALPSNQFIDAHCCCRRVRSSRPPEETK